MQLLKREREKERILDSFRKFFAVTLVWIICTRNFLLFDERVTVAHSLQPDPEPWTSGFFSSGKCIPSYSLAISFTLKLLIKFLPNVPQKLMSFPHIYWHRTMAVSLLFFFLGVWSLTINYPETQWDSMSTVFAFARDQLLPTPPLLWKLFGPSTAVQVRTGTLPMASDLHSSAFSKGCLSWMAQRLRAI